MSFRLVKYCFLALLCGCGNSSERERTPLSADETIAAVITPTQASPKASVVPSTTKTPAFTETLLHSTTSSSTEEPRISLAVVGDIMLARSLGNRILQNKGDGIFAAVAPTLRSADLTLGNLECAIGGDGIRAPKAYTFRAPPAAASLLHEAGFDLLSLANNHILDYGGKTLAETRTLLEPSGIVGIGAGKDELQANAPGLFTIHGVRLAFLAYVDVQPEYQGFDNRIWTAGPDSSGIAWAEPEMIREDIQGLHSRVDFIVVMFHFGEEGRAAPTKGQSTLAHEAIDSGADFVIGSHPHVLGTMEEYKGGVIVYSLGNFVFDGFTGISNESQILWITLSPGRPIAYASVTHSNCKWRPYAFGAVGRVSNGYSYSVERFPDRPSLSQEFSQGGVWGVLFGGSTVPILPARSAAVTANFCQSRARRDCSNADPIRSTHFHCMRN
jgi:poly-gamma-glutamate synthesis protein (capsule biosynthesis protein)